jgi:hypothetical protein
VTDFRITQDIASKAALSARFQTLGKIGTDLSTIGTWDPKLSRRTRILVPVDVQAYVVLGVATEDTVPVAGQENDPAPFAGGSPKPAGVHLHWAMPDALLSGGHNDATGNLAMPRLPDRWVVIRTLQPPGRNQVLVSGWVIDAPTTAVTALPAFTGTPGAAPADAVTFDPLDGVTGGPVWTASYTAALNRFAFHDPLSDLDPLKVAPNGFAGNQAVYTVAGWWTSLSDDPLGGARGAAGLDTVLAGLGWRVVHDEDDDATASPDPRVARLNNELGLEAPSEQAQARVVGGDGRTVASGLAGVSFETAYPVRDAATVWYGESLPTYNTLLHGSVLGVPVSGSLPGADDRPVPESLSVAIGSDVDDVVSAFGADGIGLDDRRAAEMLVGAFNSGLVSQLGTTDGLDALGQREHENGFWSLPGTPVAAARGDRLRTEDTLAVGPMTVGRKGRAAGSATTKQALEVAGLAWSRTFTLDHQGEGAGSSKVKRRIAEPAASQQQQAQSRQVDRPAPRFYRPQPTLLAVRGAHPNHRHHGDGLYDDSGKLLCRYPAAAVDRLDSVVDGATVVPTLGSGALPDEVLTVVREAVLLNPYGGDWLVSAGAPPADQVGPYNSRVQAEMVRLYGTDGTYDGSSHVSFAVRQAAASSSGWASMTSSEQYTQREVASQLARFSIVRGTPPSPVAITTWRQPWVPLWVEWRVTLAGTDSVRGWRLDGYDLELDPDTEPAGNPVSTTLSGRSLLGLGVGEALRRGVLAWLASEQQRQATPGRTAYSDATTLQDLADLNAPLDLVSASLDGITEELLGIDYVGHILRGDDGRPRATGAPTVLFAGTLRVDALRLVDAFGRTLDVPDATLDALHSTTALEVLDTPRTIRMRPRLQGSARWLWRLVDPAQPTGTAPEALLEAYVDQIQPGTAVNPVAGFLMPDHIDEALETFTVAGSPLGQIGHDAISSAVTWEPAPGRRVPPDAGPLVDLDAHTRLVGEIAAGMVRADAAARSLEAPPTDSALVSFLRAVDTTLWTVDTFAGLGTGTIAGLVGRPIAVVRASLALDAPDDLDEVTVTAGGGPAARGAAFDALADQHFEAALGTLTRSDDTLLGYFVDDNYEQFHLVDKVVAANARVSGRNIGQLGLLGSAVAPAETTLDHPYLVADGTIRVRRGQTVMLTLLMLPSGRAHLTSGVLPRKELALADSWVTPGLKRLVPSVRVGPLLVDPAEIRLPLVSLLTDKQTFTRRTGELTWRDDPILAATQTAYLPRLPHEVQEGWVRVTPDPGDPTAAPGGTT